MTAEHADLIAAAQRVGSPEDWGVLYTELARLAEKTPRDEIRQRQGPGGKTLDYVDARYVMKRLDNVCGPENWQRQHLIGDGGKVACGIGIFVQNIGWVWKWDGAGETDIEGEKGSFSDAFKRAAVSWGIARDLYPEPGAVPQSRPVPQRAEQSQSRNTEPDGDPGQCPKHHKDWRTGKGGSKFCSTKDSTTESGWCELHP